MTLNEKILFHQIHPLKLITDIGSIIASVYLFWKHNLLLGLIVTVVPTILVSLLLVSFVNLQRFKKSNLMTHIKRYLSPLFQGFRLLGFVIISVGAWQQQQWLILIGLLIILPAWGYGWLIFKLHQKRPGH